MRTQTVRSVVFLAGGLGLLVALFATAEFFTASLRSVCSINQFFSCATVDRSGKTSTLGIPDYAWGVVGFLALLIVAGLAERSPKDVRPAYALAGLSTAGVALAGYFVFVQLAEIHALCVVCASAETLGALVWISALVLAVRTRRRAAGGPSAREPEPPPDDG